MAWWDQFERLSENLGKLGSKRLIALGVVGLAVFAAVGLGSYYLSRPTEEVLYAGLTPQDVSRIGMVLKEAGVPFDVSSDGTKVFVHYGKTAEARMLLAERGLPGSSTAGYELFDKMGSTGLTSFMQNVTRVRTLEGELARTIQGMRGVKAARVHIVLPDPGSFRRSAQPPSASVVIRTESIRDFSSAPAIRQLVASAIPGMNVDQVTVLSTDGTILAAGGETFNAAPGKMVDLEKAVNRDVQDNIRRTLTPYLGLDNFEISVASRLNTDKRQTNETAYDPESKVERSVRTVKETGSSQSSNNRWTTTVETNIPPDQTGSLPGEQTKKNNERKEDLTNYEITTKTTSTTNEGYRIENMTVAVVINRKRLLASVGDVVTPEGLEKQIKQVEQLVETAAGIDQKRGDKVTVAAVDFFQDGRVLEPVGPAGIVDQLIGHMGSLVNAITLLVVTILLLTFGVRPVLRTLGERAAPPQLSAEAAALEAAEVRAALGGPEAAEAGEEVIEPSQSPQARLEHIVDRYEDQAVAILKQWDSELIGMGAVPVAKFLVELNRERTGHLPETASVPEPVPASNAKLAENAYAQGFKEGKAAASAEFEVEFAAQRRRFEEELVAAHARWAEQEGAVLVDKVEAGLRRIEESVSDVVARVLQPFLVDAVRRRAVDELIETLKLLLSKDEGVTLHISGPEDLLEMVRNGLYGKPVAVVYSPGEQCDIQVAAGKTFMETCLGAWMAKLKEAVES